MNAFHGHSEVSHENLRVPAKNILLREGRGLEIAQVGSREVASLHEINWCNKTWDAISGSEVSSKKNI
ncbi:hypothetical protein Hanom_Chr11g01062691 [Helianthus anomalus]